MGNRFTRILILLLCLSGLNSAQILSYSRVKDPYCQSLQQKYTPQLQQLGVDVAALHFPFPFYFSQALDLDEARQKLLPSGSIHFDRFGGKVVLQITGNYYASYAAPTLSGNQRVRKTFEEVVLPLLKVAVADMDRAVPFEAYAFEVAHHVRKKVMGVSTEGPENAVYVFSRAMGEKLARAKDPEAQQAALLESDIYLNGEPATLWVMGDDAPADVQQHHLARYKDVPETTAPPEPGSLVSSKFLPYSELADKINRESHSEKDTSPARLLSLQHVYQDKLDTMKKDLAPTAKFVDYAPPAFIAFHGEVYLQLNVETQLDQPAGSSQYKIAALAFEQHISHLLRPVDKYFQDKNSPQFEGVDFSATVHQSVKPESLSVEFVFPIDEVRRYAKYDRTGQELINHSIVLINGERVTLDLEKAEGAQ